MEKPVSLLENVKSRVNDPARMAEAVSSLLKIATALAHGQEFPFERLSKEQAADLEGILTGALEALRGRNGSKAQIALRKVKAAEVRLLDQARDALSLNMFWRKHVRAAETEKGLLIVVEPHGITSESYKEFAALETLGWRTSVDSRFAHHFPGNAACVVLRPPKALLEKEQPRPKSRKTPQKRA